MTSSTRSGLIRNTGTAAVRNAGGGVLAYGALEDLEPAFAPTPTPATPDPQTTHEALTGPDSNDWIAAMGA